MPRRPITQHLITHEQAHAIAYKHPMLNVGSVWIQSAVCFAIWFVFMHLLNKWGCQRRRGPSSQRALLAGEARKSQRLGILVPIHHRGASSP